MDLQAVILAGGLGTRLKPFTEKIPKPLVSVAGHPFLHWQLLYLRDQGVRDVLLLLAHMGNLIEEHFLAHPVDGMRLAFVHEPEPLGTGGALRHAIARLNGEFWLFNGDSFLWADLEVMANYVRGRDWKACLAALTDSTRVPVPGNVASTEGRVTAFRKNGGREQGYPWVDAGVYWMRRSLVEDGPSGRFDLESYWPVLIADQGLGAFPVEERFFDIGTPERLREFEEHLHDYF